MHLLTLSAKLLVLSQLAPSTSYHRTLTQLFAYLTTLARYDLIYTVRDRARFLVGLLQAAGVGAMADGEGAHVVLGDDDFARGVEIPVEREQAAGPSTSLSADQVSRILFEGKELEEAVIQGESERCCLTLSRMLPLTLHSYTDRPRTGELGTFSAMIPTKRLSFTTLLPDYLTTVLPASIRDDLRVNKPKTGISQHQASLQGFGSSNGASGGKSGGRARGAASGPVVLTPTHFAQSQSGLARVVSSSSNGIGRVDRRENFYDSEGDEVDESDDDEEEEEEEEAEDSDEDSEEDSDEVDEDEEDEEEEDEDATEVDQSVEEIVPPVEAGPGVMADGTS